jgi:hypothetical protein
LLRFFLGLSLLLQVYRNIPDKSMEIISHVLQYEFPENSSYPYQSYAYTKPTAVSSKESASTDNSPLLLPEQIQYLSHN